MVVDPERPSLFAVERTFACTNRETGVRGIDEDWSAHIAILQLLVVSGSILTDYL